MSYLFFLPAFVRGLVARDVFAAVVPERVLLPFVAFPVVALRGGGAAFALAFAFSRGQALFPRVAFRS